LNCRLCSSVITSHFANDIMLGHDVKYYDCDICGYVQTDEPTWLDEAYASPINLSDTGIMARNLANVGLVLSTLALMRERMGRVVDYAGGHGFLVRLLRDKGVDALWMDPYSENLVARGFGYSGEEAALVTAFEAFEHFLNPIGEMTQLLDISTNILFTTTLVPHDAPQPSSWWYYGLDHGQHIGFYRIKTLYFIAERFDLRLYSDGSSVHLFTKRKLSKAKWRVLNKLASVSPSLLTFGLKPKTSSDFSSLSKR